MRLKEFHVGWPARQREARPDDNRSAAASRIGGNRGVAVFKEPPGLRAVASPEA